jgi:hypothetical protein
MRNLQSLELSECSVRGESLKPLVRAIRNHRALVKVRGGRGKGGGGRGVGSTTSA